MVRIFFAFLVSLVFTASMPGVAAAKGPDIVTVGFYPINVYEIDTANSTFRYDGYVWFRWKGEADPTETVEFVNSVETYDFAREKLLEAPQIMPDGSKYQILRIGGKFSKPFSLAEFPLDDHDMSIIIEDSMSGSDKLVYQIDKKDTSLSPSMRISGWQLNGWKAENVLNDYGSTFGDLSAAQASEYSRLKYDININRPESYFIWKLLLPLAVILSGAWISLLLNPVLIETRTALPASGLLTAVFLQQSYGTSLPETGGLVLMDKIYVVAYVLITFTLGWVVVKGRNAEQLNEAEIRAMKKRDVRALFIQAGVFVAATVVLVVTR